MPRSLLLSPFLSSFTTETKNSDNTWHPYDTPKSPITYSLPYVSPNAQKLLCHLCLTLGWRTAVARSVRTPHTPQRQKDDGSSYPQQNIESNQEEGPTGRAQLRKHRFEPQEGTTTPSQSGKQARYILRVFRGAITSHSCWGLGVQANVAGKLPRGSRVLYENPQGAALSTTEYQACRVAPQFQEVV